MLYKLAHILRDRFGFLWNIVEWCNAFVFALTHGSALRKIPGILEECSGQFTLRVAAPADAAPLVAFFAEQPEEAFKFFKPHAFDEKTLSKIIRNRAFLTFLVLDGEKIVGYFFLRCFVNGKCFKGYMVADAYRGRGIAKLEGIAMNKVNEVLGLRMFGSISPENSASMAAAKAVNEVKILETLENGDFYVEFLPKKGKNLKDIVIIANFVGTLDGVDNNRFPYLAGLLCKNNSVELITSSFSHGEKKRRNNIFCYPFKVTLLEEPGYQKNICMKRFWSHYVWGRNVVKYLKSRKKPDVVYCAVPSLTAPANVSDYCKKNGVRFIVDVQDLWPEAFQMVFKVPVLSRLVFAPFKCLANKAYKNADEIVAVSQTYVDKALSVNKKGAKGYSVFIGTSLESFDENVKNCIDQCIINFGKKDELWLGYCGTLGKSYDIPTIIDALHLLGLKHKSVPKFVVMGDGPQKDSFIAYAKLKKVDALFTGRVPYDYMCALLSICDIVVNPIIGLSVASIINKHADYASVGRPVINTQNSQEYKELIELYEMGVNCESGNAEDVAQALEKLCIDQELRIRMGKGARKCAVEKFDRVNTYCTISNMIICD